MEPILSTRSTDPGDAGKLGKSGAAAARPAPVVSDLSGDLAWTSALRDLSREHGFEPLRVEGELPVELAGTIYRTGPALFSSFGRRYDHWFDGDGAVTAVRFAGGRAEGAVKLVQTAGLVAERRAGRALYGGFGTLATGVRRWLPSPSKFKNAANTAMLVWDQRVLALWEGGKPTEIAPADLATLGEQDLGADVHVFSAHPHAVPARRAIYNFGVRYGRHTVLDLFELGDAGRARKLGEVRLARPTMINDFIATEKHLVFFVSPLELNPLKLIFGLGTLADSLRWTPEAGTEVIVVPIDEPTRVTRFTTEPFNQWHFANAYERGNEIVVDVVRYPDFSSNEWLGDLAQARVGAASPASLSRVTLDPGARRARSELRWNRHVEFPRVAPSVESRRHRVVYLATNEGADSEAFRRLPDTIARIDVESGAARLWRSPGGVVSEPIFVPRPRADATRAADEDDGWLLTLVYDPTAGASNLTVLDARDLESGALARAWFDHHVPPTFHGAFAPAAPAPRAP